MKKKIIIAVSVFVCLAIVVTGGSLYGYSKQRKPVVKGNFEWIDNGDTEIIRQRIAKEKYDKDLDVSELIADFNFEEGCFNSVDYYSDKKDTWHPANHLKNLVKLQIACNTPENKFYQDEQVKKAVLLGVNFWAEKDFYCEWNGWWNDIGVGQYLPDILLYGVEGIDPAVQQKLVDNIKKNDLENSKVFVTIKEREVEPNNANLTDNIISSMKIAVIENDGNKLMWLRSLLERELKPFPTYNWTMHRHDADGLKEDMSVLMHWHLPYFGGYGEVFITGVNRYLKYTKDTQYELSQEGIDNYTNYILDGQQYAFRDEYRDINVSGRGISRKDSLKGISGGVKNAVEILLDYGNATRNDELQETFERRFGGTDGGAGGYKYFYESDYGVYNNTNYMASVRHASNRTRLFEFLNDENPFGHYTGFGATFYYVDGDEYYNLLPMYDWNKIPGTTTRQGFLPTPNQDDSYNQKGNTNLTAGVSNGKVGASYIDMNKYGVKSNQAYFMFDDGVVCLGSDITSNKKEVIVTDINQTKLGDNVVVGSNGVRTNLENNSNQTGVYDYVYNNGIGYITGSNVTVELAHKDGDWKTINTRMDSTPLSGDLFNLYISHGTKPKHASYDYTVLMNKTLDETESYAKNPTLVTVANDKKVQAVYDSKNDILQAVFHKGAELELPNGKTISVNAPCVCIVENVNGKTVVTGVSHNFKENKVEFTVDGNTKQLDLTKKSQSFEF